MRQATLDKKIHNFIARKERQYPELAQPINTLTRDLEADMVASPLHTHAREVYAHDAKHHRRSHAAFAGIGYAM
jgi:hypothetical protein